MVTVEVNEAPISLPDGSRVVDALKAAGVTHKEGTIIGIVKGREEARKEVATEFKVITSKGEMHIELTDEKHKQTWLEAYPKLSGAPVKWSTGQAIAFGPFASNAQAGKGESEYERWTVCLGTGGYDATNSFLIISRLDHSSDYGVKGGGQFAKVISGRSVLALLTQGDVIESVQPVIKLETFANKLVTEDMGMPLEDGMEIYTQVEVEMIPKAKEGVEHFYAAVKKGTFRADFAANSFISTDYMLGELCPYENLAARSEGTVSVRTDGTYRGRIYLSKVDMTSNIYHSIVGHIVKGMELVRMASAGQRFAVKTIPERMSVLGFDLAKGLEFLDKAGIEYEAAGYKGDDAVIVEQTPMTTMEIMETRNVRLKSIPRGDLVEIKLYDDLAPSSTEYFRRATGLKEYKVGTLPVYFKYEDTLLFKGKSVTLVELVPENKPVDGSIIKSGEIGLTNMSAKNAGLLGVRFADNTKFGPSGEKYSGTNILGRIIDMEKIRKVKERENVYFIEA